MRHRWLLTARSQSDAGFTSAASLRCIAGRDIPAEPFVGARWMKIAGGLVLIVIASLVYGAVLYEMAMQNDRLYADEEIVLSVVQFIKLTGSFDTNWAHIPALAQTFTSDQYNFSSSILFDSLFVGDEPGIRDIRLVSVACATIALPIFYVAFTRLTNQWAAAFAVMLTALSYQSMSEGIQARPEAFVLLLFALGLLSSIEAGLRRGPERFAWLAGAGLCAGLMVASKFSLVFCAPLFALLVVVLQWRIRLFDVTLISLGALVGIALGAPHAVLDPRGAAEGVRALIDQYGGQHLPYGRAELGAAGRFAHAAVQGASHLGWAVLILAPVGLACALWKRNHALVWLAGAAMVFCAYFMTKPVFFARNYSLFIPVAALVAGYGLWALSTVLGKRPALQRGLLAVLSAMLMIQPVNASLGVRRAVMTVQSREADLIADWQNLADEANAEIANANSWSRRDMLEDFAMDAMSGPPTIYNFRQQNDPYSREVINWLVNEHGFKRVGYVPGVLASLPQSMAHFNFDTEATFLLAGRRLAPEPGQDLPLTSFCYQVAEGYVTGDFKPDGLHATAPTRAGAYGSWLGSDSAVGRSTFRSTEHGELWVAPYMTGPGAGDLFVEIDGDRRRVFSNHRWRGLVVRTDGGSPVVVAIDQGTDWGQWIASAVPFPVCED